MSGRKLMDPPTHVNILLILKGSYVKGKETKFYYTSHCWTLDIYSCCFVIFFTVVSILKEQIQLFLSYFQAAFINCGPRSGAVGWGTVLQARRSQVWFVMVSLELFHWHNPSNRTVALGLIQPLTNEYQEYFLWGKGSWCVGLTILPPSCVDCHEIWEPQPPGTLGLSRPVMGELYLYL